jgi:hypothetical protein
MVTRVESGKIKEISCEAGLRSGQRQETNNQLTDAGSSVILVKGVDIFHYCIQGKLF